MSNVGERYRQGWPRRTYKRPHYNRRNIQPRGQCDHCGIWTEHQTLREQMDYQGQPVPVGLGFWVCPRCYFKPNPQSYQPMLPPDPEPVIEHPRPNTVDFSYTPPTFASGSLPDPSIYEVGLQINVTGLGPAGVICYADGDTWRDYDTGAVVT